jgi:hypothetical protein
MKDDALSLLVFAEPIIRDLKASIENNDICTIKRCLYLLNQYRTLKKNVQGVEDEVEISHLIETAQQKCLVWFQSLAAKDKIEVYHANEAQWYGVQILSNRIAISREVEVHYLGWEKKYDKIIKIGEDTTNPFGTFIFPKTKPPSRNKVKMPVATSEPIIIMPESKPEPEAEVVTVSGRPARKCSTQASTAQALSKSRLGSKKSSAQDVNVTFSDWTCSLCGLLEAPSGCELLVCDGSCKRSFHSDCLSIDPAAIAQWKCEPCRTGRHVCFVCNQVGIDFLNVVKCQVHTCGKYYHSHCLQAADAPFLRLPV